MIEIPNPVEKIIAIDDVLAMLANLRLDIIKDGRIVDLACGHKTLTKNRKKAQCPRCGEMLRRSISGRYDEDHDSFRKGLRRDTMIWGEDPFRIYHEATFAQSLIGDHR